MVAKPSVSGAIHEYDIAKTVLVETRKLDLLRTDDCQVGKLWVP